MMKIFGLEMSRVRPQILWELTQLEAFLELLELEMEFQEESLPEGPRKRIALLLESARRSLKTLRDLS